MGKLYYLENVFPESEGWHYYHRLKELVKWEQGKIKLFGKELYEPRLSAFYGDGGKNYKYSNKVMVPRPWFVELEQIREVIGEVTGVKYNGVLLNFYRTGADCMGMHSDDEKELVKEDGIASVSFGAERIINFQHKKEKLAINVKLKNGSVLLMKGETQVNWKHGIAKSKNLNEGRINLTFRSVG